MNHLPVRLLGAALLLLVAVRAAAAPCQDRFCGVSDQINVQIKSLSPERRIQDFIRANNLKSFTSARGVPVFATPGRLFSGGVWNAVTGGLSSGARDYLTQLSPNLVEFSVGSFHHLFTRVGERSYDNISSLSDERWRGPSSGDRLSVLVHLTDSEMGRLRQWIDRAVRDHDGTLGRFCFGGGNPNAPGPSKRSNCTSWITYAKVGDRGETLGELVGLGNYGEPYSWVKGLASRGNNRVKAVVVHKPDESRPFDQRYLDQLFDRYTYRGH